jgi:hypothetical protein
MNNALNGSDRHDPWLGKAGGSRTSCRQVATGTGPAAAVVSDEAHVAAAIARRCLPRPAVTTAGAIAEPPRTSHLGRRPWSALCCRAGEGQDREEGRREHGKAMKRSRLGYLLPCAPCCRPVAGQRRWSLASQRGSLPARWHAGGSLERAPAALLVMTAGLGGTGLCLGTVLGLFNDKAGVVTTVAVALAASTPACRWPHLLPASRKSPRVTSRRTTHGNSRSHLPPCANVTISPRLGR